MIRRIYAYIFIFFFLFFVVTFTTKAIASTGTWQLTQGLSLPHDLPTVTLLPNNKLLVAGYDRNVELFDLQTHDWVTVDGALKDLHHDHTATLLNNGEVLLIGLANNADGLDARYGELFNYTNNSWRQTGNLNIHKRVKHTATLLPDGKVLVVGGGYGINEETLKDVEIYDPLTNSWTTRSPMINGRNSHTATLLNNGEVLVGGGGSIGSSGSNPLPYVEIYNPTNNSWRSVESMSMARSGHTATLLQNGKVLVVGGFDKLGSDYNPPLSTAELYNPLTNTWSPAGNMVDARAWHTSTILPSGKVLVGGGVGAGSYTTTILNSVELYDPLTNSWSQVTPMNVFRFFHDAVLLPNGKVFVVGGINDKGSDQIGNSTKSAEIFDINGISNLPTPTPTISPIPTPTPPSTGGVLGVPLLRQGSRPYTDGDPSWEGQEFDHAGAGQFTCGTTMAQCGCATTSIAMVLKYYKVNKLPDGTPLDPGTLNTWLKNNNGYNRNLGVIWSVAATIAKKAKAQNPEFAYNSIEYLNDRTYNATTLTNDLQQGKPNILQVNAPGMHFVVATGKDNNTFTINDPLFNRTNLASYNNSAVSVRKFVPANSDMSYIVYVVDENVDIIVRDENGESVGESYLEYSPANLTEEPNVIDSSAVKVYYFAKPQTGDYTVELSASESTSYQLDETFITEDGEIKTDTHDGFIEPDQSANYHVAYDKDILENSTTELLVTFDTLKNDLERLYTQKKIKNKLLYISLKYQVYLAEKATMMNRQPLGSKLAILTLRSFQYELNKVRGKSITEDAYQILYNDAKLLIQQLQKSNGGTDPTPTPEPGGS